MYCAVDIRMSKFTSTLSFFFRFWLNAHDNNDAIQTALSQKNINVFLDTLKFMPHNTFIALYHERTFNTCNLFTG